MTRSERFARAWILALALFWFGLAEILDRVERRYGGTT